MTFHQLLVILSLLMRNPPVASVQISVLLGKTAMCPLACNRVYEQTCRACTLAYDKIWSACSHASHDT